MRPGRLAAGTEISSAAVPALHHMAAMHTLSRPQSSAHLRELGSHKVLRRRAGVPTSADPLAGDGRLESLALRRQFGLSNPECVR